MEKVGFLGRRVEEFSMKEKPGCLFWCVCLCLLLLTGLVSCRKTRSPPPLHSVAEPQKNELASDKQVAWSEQGQLRLVSVPSSLFVNAGCGIRSLLASRGVSGTLKEKGCLYRVGWSTPPCWSRSTSHHICSSVGASKTFLCYRIKLENMELTCCGRTSGQLWGD